MEPKKSARRWEGGANIERNSEEKIKKGKKRDRERRTKGGEGKMGKGREGKGRNVGEEGRRERATAREMENSAGL